MDTDVIEEIHEPTPSDPSVEPESSSEPGNLPFYKNWVFWCSLIAAVPGCVLATSIVRGMMSNGPTFSAMLWVTSGGSFFASFATIALPLLLALGKFQGGQLVEMAVPVAPPRPSTSDDFDDDLDASDEDNEVSDLFDSTDDDIDADDFFEDDDEDDDLDDFDDF